MLNISYLSEHKSPSAHDSLAKALEENKQFKKALQSTKKALALLPNNEYLKNEVKRLTSTIQNK
jgi:hypothetical protein